MKKLLLTLTLVGATVDASMGAALCLEKNRKKSEEYKQETTALKKAKTYVKIALSFKLSRVQDFCAKTWNTLGKYDSKDNSWGLEITITP